MNFNQSTANTVHLMVVDAAGVAQTGATLTSIYYASAGTGSVGGVVAFAETDSVNMPGVYFALVSPSAFSTVGPVAITFNTDLGIPYHVVGEVVEMSNSEAATNFAEIISNQGYIQTDTGDTLTVVNDNNTKLIALEGIGIDSLLKDIRALAGQAGFRIANTTYDASNQLVTADITGFDPGIDPDTGTARVTLELEAVYNGSGQMTQYTVKEPFDPQQAQ